LGLFTGRDPFGNSGGINLYEYVGSRPSNYVDPGGLAPARIDPMVTQGKDPTPCQDKCGPDVSGWFWQDLKAHAARLQPIRLNLSFLLDFLPSVKYYMAYKWMKFSVAGSTCATGSCHDTVWLGTLQGGACVRKNILGDIGFAYLVGQLNVSVGVGAGLRSAMAGPRSAIQFAYNLAPTLGSSNPSQAIYGGFLGVQRADNLAAFGVGEGLSAANPTTYAQFLDLLESGITADNPSKTALNTFKGMYESPSGADLGRYPFTANTLTFAPAGGAGFNTRSCQPCLMAGSKTQMTTYNSGPPAGGVPSSMEAFSVLYNMYQLEQDWRMVAGMDPGPPLDDWLQHQFGNY
jgi:hypothetical protein